MAKNKSQMIFQGEDRYNISARSDDDTLQPDQPNQKQIFNYYNDHKQKEKKSPAVADTMFIHHTIDQQLQWLFDYDDTQINNFSKDERSLELLRQQTGQQMEEGLSNDSSFDEVNKFL